MLILVTAGEQLELGETGGFVGADLQGEERLWGGTLHLVVGGSIFSSRKPYGGSPGELHGRSQLAVAAGWPGARPDICMN